MKKYVSLNVRSNRALCICLKSLLIFGDIEQNFTAFKSEMHLELGKMREEMSDLISQNVANEKLIKEVLELREELKNHQKKTIKRNTSNKDTKEANDNSSIKSKQSPRKKINFLDEESTAASYSSRKGYVI